VGLRLSLLQGVCNKGLEQGPEYTETKT